MRSGYVILGGGTLDEDALAAVERKMAVVSKRVWLLSIASFAMAVVNYRRVGSIFGSFKNMENFFRPWSGR